MLLWQPQVQRLHRWLCRIIFVFIHSGTSFSININQRKNRIFLLIAILYHFYKFFNRQLIIFAQMAVSVLYSLFTLCKGKSTPPEITTSIITAVAVTPVWTLPFLSGCEGVLSDVAAPPIAEVGLTEVVPTVAGSPVGAVWTVCSWVAVGSSDCDDFSTRTA